MGGGTKGAAGAGGPMDAKTWVANFFQAAAESWAWVRNIYDMRCLSLSHVQSLIHLNPKSHQVERADVLSQRNARGLLLHGFHEHPIAFPPTFNRRLRSPPPPGDYADAAALQAAYLTRRGQEGAELVPPSYTDRILVRLCLVCWPSGLSPFTDPSHQQPKHTRSVPSPTPPRAPCSPPTTRATRGPSPPSPTTAPSLLP